MEWYIKVLKNYAVFSGRARRKEYWMFFLFNFIIASILSFFDIITGHFGASVFASIYSLAVFIPGLAVSVRRLHDTNRSGWWLLVAFIPVVGALVLLFFMVQDSQEMENQYGPNPKTSFRDESRSFI